MEVGLNFGRERQLNFPPEMFPAVSGISDGVERRKFGRGRGDPTVGRASLRTDRT